MRLVQLIAVGLLGLFLVGASPAEQADWRFIASADFDGDGRVDAVLGKMADAVDAYSRIQVKAATGRILLDMIDPSLFYEVQVGTISAPLPILLVGTPSGNWLGIEAFIYEQKSAAMQPLRWNGKARLRGRKPWFDEDRLVIWVWVERSGRAERVPYQFQKGELVPAQMQGPGATAAPGPSLVPA